MPSECVFEFDRPNPIYYSGETINGRINLSTTSPKTVNAIYIVFEGAAKVRWEYRNSQYYRGSETYVDSKIRVSDEGELTAGVHTFTFCIPLPLECPTSCVEKYGKIAYEVSLVLDRPWRFDNVFKQPITVLQTYNLNMYPELLIPLRADDVNIVCCWPCSSGSVITTLTIPFGGYAPGQRIYYTIHIDNQANGFELERISISLIQTFKFKATSPYDSKKSRKNILCKNYHEEPVHSLTKRLFKGSLVIPPVPPTSRFQRTIKIFYNIVLDINYGCNPDGKLEMPVIIGTIPLLQSAENPDSAAEWIPQTPDTPAGAAADLPPSYDNCKPPSFEQATNIGGQFVDTDVNEHHRTDNFIPRYPMYTGFATASAPPEDAPEVPLLSHPHRPSAPTSA